MGKYRNVYFMDSIYSLTRSVLPFSFITFHFSFLLGKNTNLTILFSIDECMRQAEKNYF